MTCQTGRARSIRGLIVASVTLLISLFIAGAAQSARYEALVIGQTRYAPEVGPLYNPGKDALLIERRLKSLGFHVTRVNNLSRVELLQAVREYAGRLEQAGPDAVGFLYYSGHGLANSLTLDNYLIPVDVMNTRTARLWDESVSLAQIQKILATDAPQAVQIVVLDACRELLRLPVRGAAKGMVHLPLVPSSFIAFSTSPGMTAPDGDPEALAGPYAIALDAALADGGDVVGLFEDAKYAVQARTGQLPWTANGLTKRVTLGSGRTRGPDQLDLAFWQSSFCTPGRVEGCRLYLRRFPKGEFAEFAALNIKEASSTTGAQTSGQVFPTIDGARRVALVVSVSKYSWQPTLEKSPEDAKLVRTTLQRLGFRVTTLSDPNRVQLIEGLAHFAEEAKGAEAAIVYYTGQGATVDGVNYLMPRDAVSVSRTAVTGSSVEAERFGAALAGATNVRLLVLDAARESAAVRRVTGSAGLVRETGGVSTSIVTLMAAGPGEAAIDQSPGAVTNSPFALALTHGLSRPGMTTGELPSFVQAEVQRLTEGHQTPDLQGIWRNVRWSFDPKGPSQTTTAGADITKVKWERDQVFWQTVKDSVNPADFEAYIAASDRGDITGSFRKLAHNRIRSLGSTGVATPR